MKVRTGFITNSSSTSFLIITHDELEEEPFLELMGVAPDSPIVDLFRELYRDIVRSSQCVDFGRADAQVPPEAWFDGERLSAAMIERLRKAAGQGLKAYCGSLSSEESMVQTFFCTDAFEVENDRIYFNYLECVW
jgi:hypothetical protein